MGLPHTNATPYTNAQTSCILELKIILSVYFLFTFQLKLKCHHNSTGAATKAWPAPHQTPFRAKKLTEFQTGNGDPPILS